MPIATLPPICSWSFTFFVRVQHLFKAITDFYRMLTNLHQSQTVTVYFYNITKARLSTWCLRIHVFRSSAWDCKESRNQLPHFNSTNVSQCQLPVFPYICAKSTETFDSVNSSRPVHVLFILWICRAWLLVFDVFPPTSYCLLFLTRTE